MLKSLSSSLIGRGILALAVGIMALAWPSVTVLALVILFAVYAFIAAGLQAVRAFNSRTAGPVVGHLLLGGDERVHGEQDDQRQDRDAGPGQRHDPDGEGEDAAPDQGRTE